MKRASLAKNYIYNLSYQILILIVPLITTPYVSRVLGLKNIGTFNFIQSVVSYFVLFGCIGLNLYGQREIAFYRDDLKKRSSVFFELVSIRVITIGIALAIYIIGVLNLVERELQICYFLYGIEIFASLFDIGWYFQGIECFRIQTMRNIIVKVTGVLCIFLFVKDVNDLKLYILCYTATVLIGNIIMWYYLKGSIALVKPTKKDIIKHFVPAIAMFLPQIATSIYSQLDKTMVGLFSNMEQVGYYGQAEKIVKLVLTVVTAMGIVMLSRIAVSFAQKDNEAIKGYINKSFRFLFLLAWPCMIGVMVVAEGFVPWFMGDGYEKAIPCMILMSPIIMFIGVSNVIGTQYLLPTKQVKLYTISVVVGTVVNATLNAVLILKWPENGCLGAAIATDLAEFAVMSVQLFLVRKTISPKVFLYGLKNMIAAVTMGVVVFSISHNVDNLPFMPKRFERSTLTFLEIFIGGIVYVLMLVLLRDKFFFEMLNKILHRHQNED